MAQARAPGKGGFTAVHVWMIGFVFLWLTSTVLLVWLYTDQEAINNEIKSLRSTNASLTQQKNDLSNRVTQAAAIAIGEETDDATVVRDKAAQFLERVVSESLVEDTSVFQKTELLPAIVALYGDFKGERERRLAAEDRARDAEAKLQETVETHKQFREQFDLAAGELKGRVDDIESNRASYAAERDREVDDFERKLDEISQRFSREAQEQRNALAGEAERREELEKRYADLKAKVGELQITPGQMLTARMADGKVVKSVPQEGLAYISLGRAHQLIAGLRFAVYPSTGIPADGRAKGRIEVTRILDRTAECEVVSLKPTEVVVEGDLIANPVFDPQRPLRFLVIGDFDLNGDGRDDADGADTIKSIVAAWGGKVLDSLSSRVDFVVAGFAPQAPSEVSPDTARRDPGAAEHQKALARRYAEYEQVVSTATELSVPILTQDVFLRFLGF